MPQSKPRRRKGHGELVPPLSVLDRIDSLLKEHLSIFPSKPELTEAEIEHWHQDLGSFPMEAIEYAFDSWRRNARFFPVYADIVELCGAWRSSQKSSSSCDDECKARHHRGYGWNDILKLWKMAAAKRAEVNRKLTESEWETLWTELDKWRGRPPDWKLDVSFP